MTEFEKMRRLLGVVHAERSLPVTMVGMSSWNGMTAERLPCDRRSTASVSCRRRNARMKNRRGWVHAKPCHEHRPLFRR